jgi:hypothetical protein
LQKSFPPGLLLSEIAYSTIDIGTGINAKTNSAMADHPRIYPVLVKGEYEFKGGGCLNPKKKVKTAKRNQPGHSRIPQGISSPKTITEIAPAQRGPNKA